MSEYMLIYDGTFEGWLSSVFHAYEYKLLHARIVFEGHVQAGLFGRMEKVYSDASKADRVWRGLGQVHRSIPQNVLKCFLSEVKGIEDILFSYAKKCFRSKTDISKDYGDPVVLKVAQVIKQVDRERHRMEAFVRFELTKDGIYFAKVEPDFNVLPLMAKHFKDRYADQKWMIYDVSRKYGIFYDLSQVENVHFELEKSTDGLFSHEESQFQKLWQDYYHATSITERKNIKLHLRHVPRRYWKYLSEKRPE